jgi:carbon storage regulator
MASEPGQVSTFDGNRTAAQDACDGRQIDTLHGLRATDRKAVPMLVLTRKSNQSIMIGDDIEVSVLSITGEKVRIGIQAPREVPVFRREVYLEIQAERGGVDAKVPDGTSFRAEVDDALKTLGDG